MKPLLTRIAIIAVCAAVFVFVLPRSCTWIGGSSAPDSQVSTIFTPKDSAFAAVATKQHRPASTPFEKQKSPVKLPADLKETDVREAVRIIGVSPDSTSDTTVVILAQDGHIYATGGRRSLRVERWQYLPPLLAFGVYSQFGLTISLPPAASAHLSPCLAVSFLQVDGRFQLGTLLADLDGVGIGAGYRFDRFSFGALCATPYALGVVQPGIKLFITYNF